jgi:hypothetical protein
VIEHATFNPQVALDDPQGVLLLDLGHPLVRRLLDVVKDGAFRERGDHYGRTAALVTPDVSQVTALLHILARYAAGTTPPTIIEEVVPVAFPVYASTPAALDREETEALARARPSPHLHPEDQISEALRDALHAPDLEAMVRAAVEARRRELADDRRAMLTRETAQEAAVQRRWLAGIADLSVASFDVLTATVYFPEVR